MQNFENYIMSLMAKNGYFDQQYIRMNCLTRANNFEYNHAHPRLDIVGSQNASMMPSGLEMQGYIHHTPSAMPYASAPSGSQDSDEIPSITSKSQSIDSSQKSQKLNPFHISQSNGYTNFNGVFDASSGIKPKTSLSRGNVYENFNSYCGTDSLMAQRGNQNFMNVSQWNVSECSEYPKIFYQQDFPNANQLVTLGSYGIPLQNYNIFKEHSYDPKFYQQVDYNFVNVNNYDRMMSNGNGLPYVVNQTLPQETTQSNNLGIDGNK
ncbi:hypothetical protein RF11_12425 [Thelohanellus kitauei]|uniref:Uncharacterized protein n=1 Tax=Thelohanellus kitauei TaxID=669202 RepID=A0A0C2JSB3_THEKT|nr:hypothetical protein RF11_12425 [Thelohanellus kitauei]